MSSHDGLVERIYLECLDYEASPSATKKIIRLTLRECAKIAEAECPQEYPNLRELSEASQMDTLGRYYGSRNMTHILHDIYTRLAAEGEITAKPIELPLTLRGKKDEARMNLVEKIRRA